MKKILIGVVAIGGVLAASAAFAGQNDDTQTRIDMLEKENAAIRREIAALRENRVLRERSAALKSSIASPQPAPAASAQAKRDVFGAYAADMPVAYKAQPALEPRGQFRVWGEGGAIWSGGDPITQNFSLADFTSGSILGVLGIPAIGIGNVPGSFNLTPKVGWEGATGFDYRFAGSPWHVSGQFRYGESKSSGLASSVGNIDPNLLALVVANPAISFAGGNETVATGYKESHWIADLAVGRDVIGSGADAMQLKFGLRLSEFVGDLATSDSFNLAYRFAGPLLAGFPPVSAIGFNTTTLAELRSSFLGAGPRVGIEGSVPLAGGWAFDYLGDAAALFGNQKLVNPVTTTNTATPAVLVGLIGGNSFITASDQRFATVFNADIQVGVSYWMTQNVKLSASYRLDAFFGVLNQTFAVGPQTTDRYVHGPRVAVSAQF